MTRTRSIVYMLLAILIAAVGIGLVALLFDRDVLSLTGPFVAVLLVPALFVIRANWLSSRVTRLSSAAVAQLQRVSALIAAERSDPLLTRATGGSNESLGAASERVESVLQQFAWGREEEAVLFAEDLEELAKEWSATAPLTIEVGRAMATTRDLAEVLRKSTALGPTPR